MEVQDVPKLRVFLLFAPSIWFNELFNDWEIKMFGEKSNRSIAIGF